MPKLTKVLVSHVESKERSFIDYREMNGLPRDDIHQAMGNTESVQEFIDEWKFGQPFYSRKFSNEQVEEELKKITFKYFNLDDPENAEFASRWKEISLEDKEDSVEVNFT